MNTTYKELADSVLSKIKDLELARLPEEIAYEIVINYIKPACVKFQSCEQDLNDVDDELQEFNFKLTNDNFDVLSNYMIISWLDSQILTTNALKSRLTSSDFKSLNLPQTLGKITELRNDLKSENDQLAINRSYHHSSIYDIVTGNKCTRWGKRWIQK